MTTAKQPRIVCGLALASACAAATAGPVQVGPARFFGGHEYRLYVFQLNESRDWATARSFAGSIGARLVSINSAQENQFLLDTFVLPLLPGSFGEGWDHTVWTGGTDEASEGTWAWDGDPGAGVFWNGGPGGSAPAGQFANWASTEPNNQRDDDHLVLVLQGGVIVTPGLWFDAWSGQPDGADPVAGLIVELSCYPDCNSDGALNLSDFGCFQTKFALGDAYADCNADGLRNLSDFGCFQTKFALGCP